MDHDDLDFEIVIEEPEEEISGFDVPWETSDEEVKIPPEPAASREGEFPDERLLPILQDMMPWERLTEDPACKEAGPGEVMALLEELNWFDEL